MLKLTTKSWKLEVNLEQVVTLLIILKTFFLL